MSAPEMSESEQKQNNGRNPLIIMGGFVLLGLALTLLIFGSGLIGSDATQAEDTAVLEQVPAFEEAEPGSLHLPTDSTPLAVGDVAYRFTLQDLDGNVVDLNAFHGRPVIVNFWASWCAPCRIEMPELQAAFDEYQDENLAILALDQEEAPEVVEEFFHGEMGLTFTPLLDREGIVSDAYDVGRIFPSTFFINPDGEITAIHRGPMTKSQIDGYLAETFASNQ